MTELEKSRKIIDDCDKEMAKLLNKRMTAVKAIAEYKAKNFLPVEDKKREAELINSLTKEYKNDYFADFFKSNIKISKNYQQKLLETSEKLWVKTEKCGYPVFIKYGAINNLSDVADLNRKVLIVTDSGVPEEYISTVKQQIKEPYIFVLPQGEQSKSYTNYIKIAEYMIKNNFSGTDCIVALGGGMVGDIAGFVASSFMRGIDFYNIPTTVLSQADSSIGGKTAIDHLGYKNIIGAFYPPKAVIIDESTLKTLPKRQYYNGMFEALKTGVACSRELFELFKNGDIEKNTGKIIELSIKAKREIVEKDENENGLRRVLNFGHTVGHAIESTEKLLHGESIALGMTFMCSNAVKAELLPILKRMNLHIKNDFDADVLFDAIIHDKKVSGDKISVAYVEKTGTCEIKETELSELKKLLKEKTK